MPRRVVLEYPIREMREADDDEYDVVGVVDGIQRESQYAVLLRVNCWGDQKDVWFPRSKLRLEDDVVYCERSMYQEKKRDHSD